MGGSRGLKQSLRKVSCFSCWTQKQKLLFSVTEAKCLLWFLFFPPKGAEIDCEDKNGNTPLHIAARYGHELLINTLISNRADTAKYVSLSVDFSVNS